MAKQLNFTDPETGQVSSEAYATIVNVFHNFKTDSGIPESAVAVEFYNSQLDYLRKKQPVFKKVYRLVGQDWINAAMTPVPQEAVGTPEWIWQAQRNWNFIMSSDPEVFSDSIDAVPITLPEETPEPVPEDPPTDPVP